MRIKTIACTFGLMMFLVTCLSFPIRSGAVTWGYPAGSSVGQCLANQPMKKVLFPDEASALAAVQADMAEARAICDAYPDPKPLWCSHLYYWKWGCMDINQFPQCCTYTYCGMCPRVTDCGYTCKNCRGRGAIENGDWINTNYWYYVCSSSDPPPSQQQDVPVTTQVTDKNSGGSCEGTCNTIINDGGEDR